MGAFGMGVLHNISLHGSGLLSVMVLQSKRKLTSCSFNLFTIIALLVFTVLTDRCHASKDAYSDIIKLTKNTIESPNLNKDVRPLLNQSHLMTVGFSFSVASLVSVDDVTRSCSINGFLLFKWIDELLRWNASDYGGFAELQTQTSKLWHPKLILINVAGERKAIDSDVNPIIIYNNGTVIWNPGSIFSVACDMDVRKFPFDEQTCEIFLCPMGYFSDKLVFMASISEAQNAFFSANREWDMTGTFVSVSEMATPSGAFSCPRVALQLKRRPAHFVFSVLAPVQMLSFLNLLVFTIPAKSGEKISYGITVLLSIAVYMSQVNAMLPEDSNDVPAVTIYMFLLMANSVSSVLASIATVYLYHSKENEIEEEQIANSECNPYPPRVIARGVNMNFRASETDSKAGSSMTSNRFDEVSTILQKNRYHWFKKHIDRISLTFFAISWIGVSLWFFIYVTI